MLHCGTFLCVHTKYRRKRRLGSQPHHNVVLVELLVKVWPNSLGSTFQNMTDVNAANRDGNTALLTPAQAKIRNDFAGVCSWIEILKVCAKESTMAHH